MTATSLRALLQQAVDRRQAAGQDASFRALQVAVESEEAVRPRGLSLNRTTASQILRGTYKGDASAGTIRAVGWLANVDDEVAFAAAGRSVPGPPFAEELPPGVDDLSPKERRAAIEILRALVAQRQEINSYVDSSSGTTSTPASSSKATGKKTRGHLSTVSRNTSSSGRRGLDISHTTESSSDSTSNVSEEVEDRPAAARRGKGKTKGELLRDRDAQLGEESQDPEGMD